MDKNNIAFREIKVPSPTCLSVTKHYFNLLFQNWIDRLNGCGTLMDITDLLNQQGCSQGLALKYPFDSQLYTVSQYKLRLIDGLLKELVNETAQCCDVTVVWPTILLRTLYKSAYQSLCTVPITENMLQSSHELALTATEIIKVCAYTTFPADFLLPITIKTGAGVIVEKLHCNMFFVLGLFLAFIGSNLVIDMSGMNFDGSSLLDTFCYRKYSRQAFAAQSAIYPHFIDGVIIIYVDDWVYVYIHASINFHEGYKAGVVYSKLR